MPIHIDWKGKEVSIVSDLKELYSSFIFFEA
ncbi:hypothetical protein M2266_002311 [Streptomyces sp. SPB162]|nr:hypothetical protein [Streptomyces sp. SPB162]